MMNFIQSINPFAAANPPLPIPVADKNRQWTTTQSGLDSLKLGDAQVPKPEDGEVLVQIRAVSLNPRDTEVIQGLYNRHATMRKSDTGDLVPCSDMCGIVVESRSSRLKPGARVMSIFNQSHLTGELTEKDLATGLGLPLPGVLTEYRCFAAESLVPAPDYLSDEEACCLPSASVSAWMCINGHRPLGSPAKPQKDDDDKTAGETVLLQGTGGVSLAGLQVAHAAGLETIITASSDDALARAKKDLHADHTINDRTHWEWQDPVLDKTHGRGASIIFETHGSTRTLRKSLACVSVGGRIACVGSAAAAEDAPETRAVNVGALAVRRGVTLEGVVNGPRDRFEEMLKFYETHGIRPVVDRVFAFGEAGEAMKYLDGGERFGKVVVKVAGG